MNTRTLILIVSLATLASCSDEPEADLPVRGSLNIHPAADDIDDALVRENNKGVALMGKFDYESAVDHFTELRKTQPYIHDITVNLAIAILNRQRDGDEPRALDLLNEVIEKDPTHLRARYCAGLLYLNAGDASRALEYFQAVAIAAPDNAFAQYYTGLCLTQIGEADAALEHYERAIALDPYLRSGYYGLFQTLQRAGETDRAKEMLALFQKLADNPRAQLAEFKYTRMGELAMATVFDNPNAEPVPPADPFKAFGEPVELIPGIDFNSAGSTTASITAADIDGDGDLDLLLTSISPADAGFSNTVLVHENGTFTIDPDSPLNSITNVNAALWGDIDNDGDIDVYLCRDGPNVLMLREGGIWRDATEDFGVSGDNTNTTNGVLVDADHDGDLDIFLANDRAPNALLNNNRDGTFTDIAPDRGITGNASVRPIGAVFADLDNDRDLDFIVLNAEPPHEVYENQLLWNYEPMAGFSTFKSTTLRSLTVADTDTDGIPELFTVDGTTMSHWFPQNGEWTNVHNRPVKNSDRLTMFDADNDGAHDILHSGENHATLAQLHPGDDTWSHKGELTAITPVVLDPTAGIELLAFRNGAPVRFPAGDGRQNALALKLAGAENAADQMRTNFSAIGTTVRARTGSRWTTVTTLPNSTSITGQSLTPISLGIGDAQHIDYLEILWPDGVYQTELGLEAGKLHEISETQRQLSSCPVLFAWNGSEYGFVSDILGTGGIGFAVGPGEYATPDPTERFLFPEGSIVPKDGVFSIKIGEPMEEVAYFDRIALFAYDLPEGWDMTLDERMHTGTGPAPTGDAVYFRNTATPSRILNEREQNITRELSAQDSLAAPLPPLDPRFIGRTDEHAITLEFAEPIDTMPGEPVLVIDGWVEYPYSQVMFAAWQAGAAYEPITLEALDPETGEWVTLLHQFGYPAGMPRQMSVRIPELPTGATSLRMRTTLEIYFDRVFIAYSETCDQVRVRELALSGASVDVVGFPRRIDHAQRRPDYDYADRAPLWDTRHPEGWYTSLGPCAPLLEREDGALAIIGPGEEVDLRFHAILEELPANARRRFVLDTKGWCKDMDLYTRGADSIMPMPAVGIDEDARELQAEYSVRWVGGK